MNKRQASPPIPEAVPVRGRNSKAPWEVRHGRKPHTNLREHRMEADFTSEPCLRCGRAIRRTRIAQRGTHYCPGCQS